MPASYDLSLYRGDTGAWQFLLWRDAGRTSAVDLTGAGVAAQFRGTPGGGVLADFTATVSLPNRVDLVIPAAVSAALKPVRGYWDLQVTYSTGSVQTVIGGRLSVCADVTVVAA